MFQLFLALWTGLFLPAAPSYDVVVYGGTPGGIAAAVSSARLGHTVALVEYHNHLGGMSASGLGKSDIETPEAVNGLFREFVSRVHKHYIDKYGLGSTNEKLSRNGYYYEPSVAERVFDEMIGGESRIRVFRFHEIDEVSRQGKRITSLRVRNRKSNSIEELRGRIFIDATYEGDLAAYAGARYRVGRESRADFNELHAGVVYLDYDTRAFLSGTTGEGDRRIPAYTFRLCLTTDPANSRVLASPPRNYDRTVYLGYIDDWKAGRMAPPSVMKDGVGYFGPTFNTVVRALSFAELPNKKMDVNINPRPLGFLFGEENYDYPEAKWSEREKITERIRNLTIGLLYFLQNDEAVPLEQRQLARRFHLAKDEFTDSENFPWQLYVREARRLIGLYTLSENDTILEPGKGRTRIHADSIAAGEFPVDSFPVRKREPGHGRVLEGYIFMLDNLTRPYQIPYRIMVPESVDGLLVPVAASTTHVAFSTVRMEPTWMALGQAAGAAAHLAIEGEQQPREIDISRLQRLLIEKGQILTYFKDIDLNDPAHQAGQYFGTMGFFKDYYFRSKEPVDRALADEWLAKALPGTKLPSSAQQTVLQAEVAALLPGLRADWRGAGRSADSPVSRGEFCMALYQSLSRARDQR